jgi:hypothetical protein
MPRIKTLLGMCCLLVTNTTFGQSTSGIPYQSLSGLFVATLPDVKSTNTDRVPTTLVHLLGVAPGVIVVNITAKANIGPFTNPWIRRLGVAISLGKGPEGADERICANHADTANDLLGGWFSVSATCILKIEQEGDYRLRLDAGTSQYSQIIQYSARYALMRLGDKGVH